METNNDKKRNRRKGGNGSAVLGKTVVWFLITLRKFQME